MNYQPSLFTPAGENMPCAEIVEVLPPAYAAVLIRACLDTERQYIALRRLAAKARGATPGWFSAVCAELAIDQAAPPQGSLL